MKGIILAGGKGTRLHPMTVTVSKHLLPVYDKPLIYYPLCVLMLAGIREILVITNPEDVDIFKKALGTGEQFGVSLSYETQSAANGIAEAFIIGEKFIGDENICLILGDNIFYGPGFSSLLRKSVDSLRTATIFGYPVSDPERFGVAEVDNQNKVVRLQEKPSNPRSNIAITGLYLYDRSVVEIAKTIKPSARNELEITAINEIYLRERSLEIQLLGRAFNWIDAGTTDSLLSAALLIKAHQERQGLKISCPEEIALKNKWIDAEKVMKSVVCSNNSEYGKYLMKLIY